MANLLIYKYSNLWTRHQYEPQIAMFLALEDRDDDDDGEKRGAAQAYAHAHA
jgi:hypothetical protein